MLECYAGGRARQPTQAIIHLSIQALLKGHSYLHEVVGLERGAADKATVDIGVGEELFGVGRLAAAAIEYAGLVGHLFAILLSDESTDVGVDFLSLVGSGGLAGADSPYWFVGYDYFLELLGGEVEETILNLTAYHFELFAGLTLIEDLAAADDGADLVLEQLVNLYSYVL